MRLPSPRPRQQRGEDARDMHERLWQAYQAHPALRIVIESAPGQAGHDLQTFSSNLHRFWRARGFQLRCHQTKDKSGFHAWLEAV